MAEVKQISSIPVTRQREKRILSEEIEQLKRDRDALSLENSRRVNQVEHVSSDKETLRLQLRDSEGTVRMLRNQVSHARFKPGTVSWRGTVAENFPLVLKDPG